MSFAKLIGDIQKGNFQPVYYLYGEEGYYLDQLEAALEKHVLAGAEPSFNLEIFYGPECQAGQLIASARSFPVMATRRLVLVREAHRLKKEALDALAVYLDNPVPSTVLAFVHREKKAPDARTAFGKKLKAQTTVFEAKALYDNQVPAAVESILQARGITIEPKALHLLVANLGTRLGRIVTEIDKLVLQLPSSGPKTITSALVHEFVGIDREFNVFELVNHIGARRVAQAHTTLHYLTQNLRANPAVLIIGQLYTYFSKLALLKQGKITSDKGIASALGIPPFFAKDYALALGNFSQEQLQRSLKHIASADQALKGITPTRMDEVHILKTLLFNLLQRG